MNTRRCYPFVGVTRLPGVAMRVTRFSSYFTHLTRRNLSDNHAQKANSAELKKCGNYSPAHYQWRQIAMAPLYSLLSPLKIGSTYDGKGSILVWYNINGKNLESLFILDCISVSVKFIYGPCESTMHYNGAEPKCFHHRVTYFYLVFLFSEFTPIIC